MSMSSGSSDASSPPASPTAAPLHALGEAWAAPRVAGHDDDGEAILVEEDPQPHEIAEDPGMRCRYPSKHCLRRRTVKKTGALHSMCAFHRAKANRNQRRLEKRKRVLKDRQRAPKPSRQQQKQLQQQPQQQQQLPSPQQLAVRPKAAPLRPISTTTTRVAPVRVDASPRGVSFDFSALEPFRAPVPLFKEDLDELRALVDVSFAVQHRGFFVV